MCGSLRQRNKDDVMTALSVIVAIALMGMIAGMAIFAVALIYRMWRG